MKRYNLKSLMILLILLLCTQCGENEMRYEFFDGNNNLYKIESLSVEYIPVKPEESSSGFYSGGKYVKTKITADQFEKISNCFNDGAKNHAVQLEQRVKMSGLLKLVNLKDGSYMSVILAPGAKELTELEKLLKEIIKQ